MGLAWLANRAWMAAQAGSARRFERALRRPREAQAALLAKQLRENAGTAYGKLHGFERIGSLEEYGRRVPLTTYEEYRPYIERIAAGEEGVLTAARVRYFALSSGSAGAEKWIPYTAGLLKEFGCGIAPWICNLFRTYPALRGGRAYWSVTPVGWQENRRASKVPVGFEEDSAYLGGMGQRLLRRVFAVPETLRRVEDMETFRYLTLLCLLRAEDLRIVSVWHPSFLKLLLDAAEGFWDRLLADLRTGECRPPGEGRFANVVGAARAMPRRAEALRRAGPRGFANWWPRLGLINCWRDAQARGPADELAGLFPGVVVQGKGLLSTEAFVSLPRVGAAGEVRYPLAVCSHVIELMGEDGVAVSCADAEVGGLYRVIATTAGGLYRYQTQDEVRVTGRCEETPCIEFIGRGDHVSDLCGEKLSGTFVGEVLTALREELACAFTMLAPDGAGYTLFTEGRSTAADLGERLDRLLARNPHYRYCRALGQLRAARVYQIAEGANGAAIYLEYCRSQGMRLGAIKPVALHKDGGWAGRFPGSYVEAPAAVASTG